MPSRLTVVLNGAAVVVMAAAAIALVRSIVSPDTIEACSQRYDRITQLSLSRPNGDLFAGADLQARFGGSDWGLLDNAKVVSRSDGPAGHAIEVRLANTAADPSSEAEPRRGMSFTWQPKLAEQKRSACLSYAVFVPKDFTFGKSGRLPGVVGLADDGRSAPLFSAPIGWRDDGTLEVNARLPEGPSGHRTVNIRGKAVLARGKWLAIEQEIVLNAPGRADGTVRMWADGRLNLEKSGLAFEDNADVHAFGALVEASVGPPDAGTAAKPQTLWLSPVELRAR